MELEPPPPQQEQHIHPSSSTTSTQVTHPPPPPSRQNSSTSEHISVSLTAPLPSTASPFPSPSSSFLPPPTPGAHEFAMKPPPGVAGRRGSGVSVSSAVGGCNGLGVNGKNAEGGHHGETGRTTTRSRSSSHRSVNGGGSTPTTHLHTQAPLGIGTSQQHSEVAAAAQSHESHLEDKMTRISTSTSLLSSTHTDMVSSPKSPQSTSASLSPSLSTPPYVQGHEAYSTFAGTAKDNKDGKVDGENEEKTQAPGGEAFGFGLKSDSGYPQSGFNNQFAAVPDSDSSHAAPSAVWKNVNALGERIVSAGVSVLGSAGTSALGLGEGAPGVNGTSEEEEGGGVGMDMGSKMSTKTKSAVSPSTPTPTSALAPSSSSKSNPAPNSHSHLSSSTSTSTSTLTSTQTQTPTVNPQTQTPTQTPTTQPTTPASPTQQKKRENRTSVPPPSSFPAALTSSSSSSSHKPSSSVSSSTGTTASSTVSSNSNSNSNSSSGSGSGSTNVNVLSASPSSHPLSASTSTLTSSNNIPNNTSTTTSMAIPQTPTRPPALRSRPPSSSFFDPSAPLSPYLASSRPAPPSPALSATSTSKGGRSRPGSGVFTLDSPGPGPGKMSRQNSMSRGKRVSGLGMSAFGPSGGSVPISASPTNARFPPSFSASTSTPSPPVVHPFSAPPPPSLAGCGREEGEEGGEWDGDGGMTPPPDSAASVESLESNASTVVPDRDDGRGEEWEKEEGLRTPGVRTAVFKVPQSQVAKSEPRGDLSSSIAGDRTATTESEDYESAADVEDAEDTKDSDVKDHIQATDSKDHIQDAGGAELKVQNKKPRTMYIKIRDYAFTPDDVRFVGMGPTVPRENRVGRLNRVLRGAGRGYDPYAKRKREDGDDAEKRFSQGSWSSSTSFPHSPTTPSSSFPGSGSFDDDEDTDRYYDDEEDEDPYGFNGGGWGIGGTYGGGGGGSGGGGWFKQGLGQLSWAGVGSSATPEDDDPSSSGYPSATDLARNFDHEDGEDGYYGDEGQQGYGDEQDSFEDEDDADDPLYPGIYRALFAFEPEGTAEVRLREDQLVRVVKRGGGVGWAVVEVGWRASRELVGELRESGELDVDECDGEGEDEGEDKKEEAGGVEVELPDGRKLRQGLVPESYLAPVRLDGWVDCS